jgi:spore coat polysaccharide biosynthesis predicted glycosyltransferase SpsG
MEAQVLLGWRFALYYIRFIQRRKKKMLEKDKIYSLRLSDSSEIICKIVSTDSNETIISSPFSLIPTQQGVQLLPAMMSADETKNVTINTNNITMYTETNKDIIASYIQASTGIVTPTKGILKG